MGYMNDGGSTSENSTVRNVAFPSATTIGTYAFACLLSLVSVSVPLLPNVPNGVFYRCETLPSISLPMASIIMSNAFMRCSSLESVYLLSTAMCQLSGSDHFASSPITDSSYLGHYGSIFVPESLVNTYKTNASWASYADRITAYIP